MSRPSKLAVALLISVLPTIGRSETAAKPSASGARVRAVSAVQAESPVVTTEPQPIPSMTLDESPAIAPRIAYVDGVLTVEATNATLGDVLAAIRSSTGLRIKMPPGDFTERVAAHLAGPLNTVIPALLDGSKFGYIMIASPDAPAQIREILLSAKPQAGSPNSNPQPTPSRAYHAPAAMARPASPISDLAEAVPNTATGADMLQAAQAVGSPEQADEPAPIPEAPTQAAAYGTTAEEAHPPAPIQVSTVQLSQEQAQQQQETNRKFMQDLYQARQKLQTQVPQ